MFRSIRWRIAVPYAVLILVTMIGLATYLSRLSQRVSLEARRQALQRDAQLLANVARPLWSDDVQTLDALAHEWGETLALRITLIDDDGRVLGESQQERAAMDNHLNRPEIQEARTAGVGSNLRQSGTLGISLLYVAVPLIDENEEIVGYVRVALPSEDLLAASARLRTSILAAALVMAVIAVVLAIVIAERTARPVRRLTRAAGRLAAGDLSARLINTSRDEVGVLTTAFNDMAEQMRDKVDTLARERTRLASILEHMADGVVITDQIGRVLLINPAARDMLETTGKQALGVPFARVARHHRIIDTWQRCRQSGQEQVEAIEVGAAPGGQDGLFLQMIATPLGMDGEAGTGSSHLVILQNLTTIRRLETVRRDFISNISHELRTPLASLKALVETLRDSALDDPPAARRFLDHAEQEVDALTQIVQELLELSRIESGRVPLRLAPTDIAHVIHTVIERLQPQAQRAQLLLEVSVPADLPPVLIDEARIQQVLANLVHNAIKFTPAGGQVTVKAAGEEDTVVISVKDTGVGIAEMDLPRIFERFYKASRARSGGGTGLGLAIARHLVQAHGGRIWAKSKEGKGSTFFFSLPVANGDAPPVTPE